MMSSRIVNRPLGVILLPVIVLILLIGLFVTPRAEAQIVVNENTDVIGSWTATGNGTIQIRIRGADGGEGDEGAVPGGEGASLEATFSVTTGQVVSYVVGEVGFDGDGPGDYAGGGGSTGVLIDNVLVMVAGAGGGAGGGRSGGSEDGLGGNVGTAGDTGQNGGGAGGTNGTGGASNGDGGGGGGGGVGLSQGNANGTGGSGTAGGGSGATDFTAPLSFAAGGVDFDHGGVGGRGFTGGGGGAHHESGGGGGGYSGGGSGGFEGAGGGGGSFINTSASEYVSTDATINGSNGGGTQLDGAIIIDFTAFLTPDLSIDKDTSTPSRI